MDKAEREARLNSLVSAHHGISAIWRDSEDLSKNPDLTEQQRNYYTEVAKQTRIEMEDIATQLKLLVTAPGN